MKYLRILLACAAEPWAIQREKMEAILQLLAFQADGGKFSDVEIEARTQGRREPEGAPASAGGVAVLPVYGVIAQRMGLMGEISGGTSLESLARQFRALLADDEVRAIVLNFDSPGGTTFGVDEFAQEIYEARGIKPIIAQVDSVAASAAYWLASAADRIAVTPGGLAGSIGVFAIHDDVSRMLDRMGVTKTVISSGPNKASALPFRPLSEDARAEIQKRVDAANAMFTEAVARGRRVTTDIVNERFGQGLVFTARDLVARGMADEVATLRQTLERLGVQMSPKRSAAADVRRAFASNEIPPLSTFEDGLREAFHCSKSQATAIAGHGLKPLQRSESAPESRSESGNVAISSAAVDQMMGTLRSLKIPKIGT